MISFKEYSKTEIDYRAIDIINIVIKILEENQFPNEGSPKKKLDLEELQSTSVKTFIFSFWITIFE